MGPRFGAHLYASSGHVRTPPLSGFAPAGWFPPSLLSSVRCFSDSKPQNTHEPLSKWSKKQVVAWLEELKAEAEFELDVQRVAAPGHIFAKFTEAHLKEMAGGTVGIPIFIAKEELLEKETISPPEPTEDFAGWFRSDHNTFKLTATDAKAADEFNAAIDSAASEGRILDVSICLEAGTEPELKAQIAPGAWPLFAASKQVEAFGAIVRG